MLVLKLLLVPAFLLLISLAGRRYGPALAGWLAGLPVVAGPILLFLALERGPAFAATASALSLSAVLASVSFSLAYAHAAQRLSWPLATVVGLMAWSVAALVLSALPMSGAAGLGGALGVALATLLVAPRFFPRLALPSSTRVASHVELVLRMVAGALLTVSVTVAAGLLGPDWSGLLAVFPILGIVLAVFSHRGLGAAHAAALLRAMATGLYSFVAFCFVLSLTLRAMGLAPAFALAVLASAFVQAMTWARHRRGG